MEIKEIIELIKAVSENDLCTAFFYTLPCFVRF